MPAAMKKNSRTRCQIGSLPSASNMIACSVPAPDLDVELPGQVALIVFLGLRVDPLVVGVGDLAEPHARAQSTGELGEVGGIARGPFDGEAAVLLLHGGEPQARGIPALVDLALRIRGLVAVVLLLVLGEAAALAGLGEDQRELVHDERGCALLGLELVARD